ncbi:DinB family protein [bacterium]|nr:DinB family protein [bacterium]
MAPQAVATVQPQRQFLMNVLKDFKEEHENFKPTDDMMTVAQQIRHIARVTDWFREAGFGAGFNMDFEAEMAEMVKPVTLAQAMAELNEAFDRFMEVAEKATEAEIFAPLPPNPILGEAPRIVIFSANADHVAHHRGALTVYQRLLGMTPRMAYDG